MKSEGDTTLNNAHLQHTSVYLCVLKSSYEIYIMSIFFKSIFHKQSQRKNGIEIGDFNASILSFHS